MIVGVFVINGVTNKDGAIKNIEMINARNKLKAYKDKNLLNANKKINIRKINFLQLNIVK